MASNNKSRARAEANKLKGDKKFTKVMTDLGRILDNEGEEFLNHGTPGGQAFTCHIDPPYRK